LTLVRQGSIPACLALTAFALALPASAAAAPVPLAQVGSSGSGAGQLSSPRSVAIDGAGHLYVAEFVNRRISVFGADGAFIHAFGWGVDTGASAFEVCTTASTCQAGLSGGGAGQLDGPHAVALDGAGNLFVTELESDRISVFAAAGPSFTRAFGWGVDTGASVFEVCTTASTCQAGIAGDGDGQLANPTGVALDGAGDLYVTDSGNSRISVFGAAGPSFTRAFGWGVDTGASAFEVCTTASTCQAGLSGGGAGQLASPGGIVLDGVGGLYVPDGLNNRISVFGTAGPSFTRAFGFGVDTGASAFEVCTTASTCQAGLGTGAAGDLDFPRGTALDGAGGLYVAEQSNLRISLFGAAGPSFTHAFGFGVDTGASAFEVCTTASTCQAGILGAGVGQLSAPFGVAIDLCGAAWVADTGNGRLQRFGEPGTALPPCAAVPPPVGPTAPAAAPSNAFTLGPISRNKKKGTATINLTLPNPGELTGSGSGVKASSAGRAVTSKSVGAGQAQLLIKATGKKKRKLNETGKVKLSVVVTYTPTGGDPSTQPVKVKLKKKL
jgi:tripartite motif-containing protein 71